MRDHDLALEFRLEQVFPGFGAPRQGALQPIFIGGKTQRADVDAGPEIIGVFVQLLVAQILEVGRIIGFQHASFFPGHIGVNRAAPPDIELGVVFFGLQASQSFTRRHAHIVDRDIVLGFELLLHPLAPLFLRCTQDVELRILRGCRSGGLAGTQDQHDDYNNRQNELLFHLFKPPRSVLMD
jgi:hypothetical protein